MFRTSKLSAHALAKTSIYYTAEVDYQYIIGCAILQAIMYRYSFYVLIFMSLNDTCERNHGTNKGNSVNMNMNNVILSLRIRMDRPEQTV